MLTLKLKPDEAIVIYTSDGPVRMTIARSGRNDGRPPTAAYLAFDLPDAIQVEREPK